MSEQKTIVLTGGGTAGHVIPNLVLAKRFLALGWRVEYVGSYSGMERRMVQEAGPAVNYHPILTGKLRRYFSWQNFLDLIKVPLGALQSLYYLIKLRPKIVFSKGGYVGLPVAIAASLLGQTLVVHESDLTPGLANRIAFPLAKRIALSFNYTKQSLKPSQQQKAVVTGIPLREGFKQPISSQKLSELMPNSDSALPLITIFGGSLGAEAINQAVRAILPQLATKYRVLHVCGMHGVDPSVTSPNYAQFTYLTELPSILVATDLVVCRAGATTLYELLSLRKPSILIPLVHGSRGDQVINARYFQQKGYSYLLNENEMLQQPMRLLNLINQHFSNPSRLKNLAAYQAADGLAELMKLLLSL